MRSKQKLILDCDPGTDDSVCIMMALTHPDVELLAIIAESGNLTCDITSQNALRILEYLNRPEIPVAKGAMHPLIRKHPSDPYSHGEDGLGNHFFPAPKLRPVEKHAALLIIDQVLKYPHEVTLVCTAPLTNLALAILINPDIVPLIKKVYHLGGSYGFHDCAFTNATGDNPVSEWNVFVDPEAAKIVYESGLNLVTIGLDVAYNQKVNITEGTMRRLRGLNTKEAKYALDILNYIQEANAIPGSETKINGTIDTVAMCAFLRPEILKTQRINMMVVTGDQVTRGMTIWDRRIWKKRMLTHFDGFAEIETAYDIDEIAYQTVYYEALGGCLLRGAR